MRQLAAALTAAVALALAPAAAQATTFHVTSTADTNTTGTLRNAINLANSNSGPDGIDFSGLAGTSTIALSSTLPPIADPVTIDATANESTPGTPAVILSGTGVTGSGLVFNPGADPSAVKGLSIINFSSANAVFIGENNVTVSGNYLGVDPSGAAQGNSDGVTIFGTAALTGDVIGGTGANDRNVISGNHVDGIDIINANGVQVQGNYIGLSPDGFSARPNGSGIAIGSGVLTGVTETGTVIGGPTVAERNVISGNNSDGILLLDNTVTQTDIEGNYIGTQASGFAALPNVQNGIDIAHISGVSASFDNDIGKAVAGGGNVISGNGTSGVRISNDSSFDRVNGNFIGTNANGTAAIGNNRGILVQDTANHVTIGNTTAASRNVISGNRDMGILITQSASDVVTTNNYIGLDANGARDGNARGIVVDSNGLGNIIGDPTGTGNVISGNSGPGIDMQGTFENIAKNVIGLDPTGSVPKSNGGTGVLLTGSFNTLDNNLIASNEGAGVALGGDQNIVQANKIGTDTTGTKARGNFAVGVAVASAKHGTINQNLISGNPTAGVQVNGPSDLLTITGNNIGTDAAGSNPLATPQQFGIDVTASLGDVTNTAIGGLNPGEGNTIAFNDTGISLPTAPNTSLGTSIRANSIFGSGSGLGIDLLGDGAVTPNDAADADGGPNNTQNFPVLTSAVTSGGQTVIDGTLASTPSTNGYGIDLFSSPSCSKTGNGEAQTYLGSIGPVNTNASGDASFQVTLGAVPAGQVVTATATDPDGNTSELSACRTVTAPATPTGNGSGGTTQSPPPVANNTPGTVQLVPGAGPGPGGTVQVFALPVAKLRLPKIQHLLRNAGVVFTLRSSVAAAYSIAGVVQLPALGAKAMKLKSVKGKLVVGQNAKVKLRATRSLLAAARRAFASHRKVTVTISIVLKGPSGAVKHGKRKLRLVP